MKGDLQMQVAQDIYLVAGPPYGIHPNAYVVRSGNSVVLIDCGTDEEELKVIRNNIAYWGMGDCRVSALLLTHAHFDHAGNAHAVKTAGVTTVAGPGDAEAIECGDYRTMPYCYGIPFIPCPVDIVATDGQALEFEGLRFDVIHVPGHSAGSLVYRLVMGGKTVLFTGDTVFPGPDGKSAALGFTGGYDFDKNNYIRSLEKLSRVQTDMVLGGHEQPCLRNGSRVVQLGLRTALAELR